MGYVIDEGRIIDVVRRLDFPRVVGTDGEQRGYEVIRGELATLGIKAWFEEFPSPWVEITEADLRVEEEAQQSSS